MSSEIWVLLDKRAGTANQALALAEELGSYYEIKNIEYNRFSYLPNFLLRLRPIHIENKIIKSFDVSQLPQLIISAGRRTASLALYLKKQAPDKVKIVQIMKPNIPFAVFDLVILPQHDGIVQVSPNVVRIIGALTDIQAKLTKGKEVLVKYYPEVKKFIAVAIGGDTKNHKFTNVEAKKLVSILLQISVHHSIPFFFSFSRRTSDFIKQLIHKNFSWPHIIYDPESGKPNPYHGMFAKAEYIITTGDSISMCSEAASTGKPLYIFYSDSLKLKKHRFFIQQLIDLGIAKKLDQSINFLESYSYVPLNEVKKVAEIIKAELI